MTADTAPEPRSRFQTVMGWLLYPFAASFLAVGVTHFTHEAFFVAIVPDYLPAPLWLVWISGVAEIAGGVGLLLPATRRAAAWGLILLMLAVFPANLDMALNPTPIPEAPEWLNLNPPDEFALWMRLPWQGVLIAWAWVYTRRP